MGSAESWWSLSCVVSGRACCDIHTSCALSSMVQKSLESISEQLRIPGSKSLGPISQVRSASPCAPECLVVLRGPATRAIAAVAHSL